MVPHGQIKETDKFVVDYYNKKIHVGARVAFYHKNKLYMGKVIELIVHSVTQLNIMQDKLVFKVFLEEEKTKEKYEIRTLNNIIII